MSQVVPINFNQKRNESFREPFLFSPLIMAKDFGSKYLFSTYEKYKSIPFKKFVCIYARAGNLTHASTEFELQYFCNLYNKKVIFNIYSI